MGAGTRRDQKSPFVSLARLKVGKTWLNPPICQQVAFLMESMSAGPIDFVIQGAYLQPG